MCIAMDDAERTKVTKDSEPQGELVLADEKLRPKESEKATRGDDTERGVHRQGGAKCRGTGADFITRLQLLA